MDSEVDDIIRKQHSKNNDNKYHREVAKVILMKMSNRKDKQFLFTAQKTECRASQFRAQNEMKKKREITVIDDVVDELKLLCF